MLCWGRRMLHGVLERELELSSSVLSQGGVATLTD